MKIYDGTVRWFNNKAGDGMIRVDGISHFVHWSAVAKGLSKRDNTLSFKDEKSVWAVLFKGQRVKVKIIEDSHYTQIEEVL
jgi:cold shock CspA family protein